MKKKLLALALLATIATGALATTAMPISRNPAEAAGFCAGNAIAIKRYAVSVGNKGLAQFVDNQVTDLSKYSKQPGFVDAAGLALNLNLPMKSRVDEADRCTELFNQKN